eukprot:6452877-Alexandrium_andersonii.AAC.1
MSASLVGSEMCIRDRGTRSGGRATAGAGSCKAATRPASIRFWMASLSNCLLYTSDAADDM